MQTLRERTDVVPERLLLSVLETATALNLAPRTVAQLSARGILPFIKVGRRTLYPRDRLVKWIDAQADRRSEEEAGR